MTKDVFQNLCRYLPDHGVGHRVTFVSEQTKPQQKSGSVAGLSRLRINGCLRRTLYITTWLLSTDKLGVICAAVIATHCAVLPLTPPPVLIAPNSAPVLIARRLRHVTGAAVSRCPVLGKALIRPRSWMNTSDTHEALS